MSLPMDSRRLVGRNEPIVQVIPTTNEFIVKF